MPKITDVKCKSRSKRKPLRDVSNGGIKPSTTNSVMNKYNPYTQQEQQSVTTRGGGGDSLDRLLLVHSDLSTLIHQIDELVLQAVEQKVSNAKEIESFTNVLHEMQTSLKPWIPRFQKAISTHVIESEKQLETNLENMRITPSVNEEKSKKALENVKNLDFLVSPSPLVSWRADCTSEGGRNLFMLTPLPKPTPFTSRLKKSSKSVFKKITKDADMGLVGPVGPVGPLGTNSIVSTPYLKTSPPKSCVMLEPVYEGCNKINGPKSPTVKPVNGDVSGDSDPSSCQPSGHWALKYPELFGIRPVNKMGNIRKIVEASPKWCMSPPQSCVLLEPSDNLVKDGQTNFLHKASGVNVRGVISHSEVVENTPMCKDVETTIKKGGKRAGENTLKKELWTRFELATGHGLSSVNQEIDANDCTNKGFMDLLEEVV